MILGVTGNIAAGKSHVAEIFHRLGAAVLSADLLAREVVRPGSPALEALLRRFGPLILSSDGCLDRRALGEVVFRDENARRDLNAILHPAIGALAEARLRELAARNPLVVYEAPLLFEAGAEGRVDAVLVVTASPGVQLRRLVSRDGFTEEEANARISSQMPQDEKIARADFVIDNSGPPEETEAQVRRLYGKLTRSSQE